MIYVVLLAEACKAYGKRIIDVIDQNSATMLRVELFMMESSGRLTSPFVRLYEKLVTFIL